VSVRNFENCKWTDDSVALQNGVDNMTIGSYWQMRSLSSYACLAVLICVITEKYLFIITADTFRHFLKASTLANMD